MNLRNIFAREKQSLQSQDFKQNNFDSDEREVLRAIELHGGLTGVHCERLGFTINGIPMKPLARLMRQKIVAPRVLTSQPLRVVFQLKSDALNQRNEHKIAKETKRQKLKEYAPGGFKLLIDERWKRVR